MSSSATTAINGSSFREIQPGTPFSGRSSSTCQTPGGGGRRAPTDRTAPSCPTAPGVFSANHASAASANVSRCVGAIRCPCLSAARCPRGWSGPPASRPAHAALVPKADNLALDARAEATPPLSRSPTDPPEGMDVARAATTARYAGSPEHKGYVSAAGPPRLRADATPCPDDLEDAAVLTGWLREGIRRGLTGALWEQGYPRYVWWRDGDRCFEGRLTNAGSGEHKGWPLEPDEWPVELRR